MSINLSAIIELLQISLVNMIVVNSSYIKVKIYFD